MSYRIGQLILTPASKNNTISEVFVAQPDSDKEALAGKIFILLEIETKRSDGLKLVNFLINYINNSYYQNEKLVLKEKIPSLRIEHIFESVVSRANKKILEFIKEENIKLPPNSLNSTIGLIYNSEIHFSTAGKNRALLIYKKVQGDSKIYKTIDLNKNNSPEEDGQKNKLFTNVISGTIPEGSAFIFSNEALPEYLSPKQLSDIITTLPPASAVEQIKNTLSQINEYISFIGIIIKSSHLLSEEKELNTPPIQMQESINRLNDTEQSTESILSPSGNIRLKNYLGAIGAFLSRLRPKSTSADTLFLKASSKINTRALKFYSSKIFALLKSLSIHILNFLFYIFKTISSIDRMRSFLSYSKRLLNNIFYSTKNGSLKFKKKYKLIILVFIISVLGLSYEINKVKEEKVAEKNRIQYETTKESIEQKQNQAEANLLYNNEDSAKKLFIEIRKLLADFPQETEEQRGAYASFNDKLNSQLDKVRKVVEISIGDPIVNFSDINKNSKVQNIILSSGNIYAGDPDQNSIYIYSLDSELATTITDLNKKLENIRLPISSDEQTIYWHSNNSIIKLDTNTEEIFSLNLDRVPNSNIADMSTYNQRTYMLDTNSSQIFRYGKGDTGFLQFSKWLNKEIDLSGAVSLDIDGSIYTLDGDGTIRKFLKGEEEKFTQDQIEPPIDSANKIIVSKDKDFIYVLDSNNSRIVIYEKNGRFIEQHQSKSLSSISDFLVDEKNKLFYILSENQIYSIKLNHLN